MKQGIFSICGDPGGAAALAPVLVALRNSDRYRVHSAAYRQGVAQLQKRGVETTGLDESLQQADCRELLKSSDARSLLTGTSVNGFDLERKFITAARELGIPSLSVLDYWSNYRERFTGPDGSLSHLPDRIAVMDESARSEMMAQGFDGDMLIVTGQPAFDALVEKREGRERQRVRDVLGVGTDELLVVFFSQPISEISVLCGEAPDALGFTERSVLEQLIRSVDELGDDAGRSVVLLVRTHPRESVKKFEDLRCERARVLLSNYGELADIVAAADLVTGMNSVALVEACYLGALVLSLQPGLRQPDTVPTNRAGLSRPVYTAAEIRPALEEYLFDEERRKAQRAKLRDFLPNGGASQRVVAAIDELHARSLTHSVC